MASKQRFYFRFFFSPGATAPRGSGLPHYRVHTITLRHTTLGRTPLEELSARRRDLYLTTHNIHKRQASMSAAGFESANPSKRAAADPRLRLRGQWGSAFFQIMRFKDCIALASHISHARESKFIIETTCYLTILLRKVHVRISSLIDLGSGKRFSLFFFFKASRGDLWSSQCPIVWVKWAPSPGIEQAMSDAGDL